MCSASALLKSYLRIAVLQHLGLRPQLRAAGAIHAIAANERPNQLRTHSENDSG